MTAAEIREPHNEDARIISRVKSQKIRHFAGFCNGSAIHAA
jgi:hypothetical protein